MKAAILGLGKIGHNTAATLVDRGLEVTGFTRDEEKARAINEHGITVSGALNGNFKVKAFTNIAQAIDGARFLVVTTTAKGHRPMAELLKGKLQEGQRIVIFTGNWGHYEFYSVLRDEVREKHVIIGETSGNLAASPSLTYPATTFMKTSKKSMSFATIPGSTGPMVVEELKQAFPEFYAAPNVLDTSMNNTNPPVHVPFSIFNITRMANGEDAQFYGQCLPPILLDFVMAADKERCAVAKAICGRLFAVGLTLFVGCDVCVGLFNALPPGSPPYSAASVGMWFFYLPSQVLITLSALPGKEEAHEIQ